MPKSLLLAVACLVTAGCATVMNGRTAEVALQSTPSGAAVTVQDHEGMVVAQTTTPSKVKLKRNRKVLLPAHYTATFEKEGYQPSYAEIRGKLNPWIAGNVLLGGGLGIGVDAVTGALWRPDKKEIDQTLVAYSPYPNHPVAQSAATPSPAIRQASATAPIVTDAVE